MATFTESFDGSLDLSWTIVRGSQSLTVNADDTGSIDTGTDEWGFVRADGDTESADMFAEVTLTQDFNDTDRFAVLLVRAQSTTDQTYYAAILNQAAGWCTVLRYEDGAGAPIGTADEPVSIPAAPFVFRFEAEGSDLRVLLNGTVVKAETDSAITGTRGGLGVRTGGTTVRFDDYATGALSDDGDPGGGTGNVEIVAVYSDSANPPSATVTDVQDGDTLVACLGLGYEDGSAVTVSGSGAGTWQQVLVTVNEPVAEPDYENYGTTVWQKVATGFGTYEVETDPVSGEHGLVVLHLRGAGSIDDTSVHIVGQVGSDPVATQDVGGVNAAANNSLLVCGWGGVQFADDTGAFAWAVDSSGMTQQAMPVTGSGYGSFLVATEVVDSGGTGTRTATADPRPDSGFAGFALVISPGEDVGPLPDTAAERYGWGDPLPTSDEFDYVGPPDPTRWGVYDSEGHDGNGTRDPDQVTVNGEYLRIEGNATGDSGGLAHQYDQQYGRWECRARFAPETPGSAGESYHAVLIVWPNSSLPEPHWPQYGEYDWVEIEDLESSTLQAYLHYPHPEGPVEQEYVSGPSVDFSEWHNYAFEWVEGALRGYLDGDQWFELDGSKLSSSGDRLDGMPSGHLTIQLDNFTGEEGLQPAYMDVAWARVYEAEGSAAIGYADGDTGAQLAASGTSDKAASVTGDPAGARLAATGSTDGRTATATGTTRMSLTGSGAAHGRTGAARGTSAVHLAVGADSDRAATATGSTGVALAGTGVASSTIPRVGQAPAALAATGHAEGRTAATTGRAGLGLTAGGRASKGASADGRAGLALPPSAGEHDRAAAGHGHTGVELHPVTTAQDRQATTSGHTGARLDVSGTTSPVTTTTGHAGLAAYASGIANRAAYVSGARTVSLAAAGSVRRRGRTSGTARADLGATGQARDRSARARGTAPLGLAALATVHGRTATTSGTTAVALAAAQARSRPGRVTVTADAPRLSVFAHRPELRVFAANA